MAIDSKSVQGGATSSRGMTTKPVGKMESAPDPREQTITPGPAQVSTISAFAGGGYSTSSPGYDYNKYGIPTEQQDPVKKYGLYVFLVFLLGLFLFISKNK